LSNVVGPQGPENRQYGQYHVPGPTEQWIGRVVEVVAIGFGSVVFVGGVLLVLLGGVYLLAVDVLPAAGGQAVHFVQLIRAYGHPEVADLLFEALAGAPVGALIGLLRFLGRVKSRRVEQVVDAVGNRDVVSAAKLGIFYSAGHAVAGALAGAIVGWLGLPLPKLLAGDVEAVLAHATPVVAWIVGGGAGGPPGGPDSAGAGFLGLLVVALVAAVLGSLAGAAATLGVGGMVRAMAMGAAGTVGKAFGIAAVLALTRLGATAQYQRKRPQLPSGWLTLDAAVEKFVHANLDLRRAREQLEDFFLWLREQGVTPTERLPSSWVERYDLVMKARGVDPQLAVRQFFLWVGRESWWRPYPLPVEAADERVWLEKVAFEAFSKGWIVRTLAQGALAGAMIGALQALLAGTLLLLRR